MVAVTREDVAIRSWSPAQYHVGVELRAGTAEGEVQARVLLTGSRGMIGAEVTNQLAAAGFDVVGLDIADGDDVNDPDTVSRLIDGCSHVVHAAALDDEPAEPDPLMTMSTGDCEQVMRTNVGGTSVLLAAAARAGVKRFVFLSSVDVFGCFMGTGTPAYLPIDDEHLVDPHGPYAWSKLAGEELCASYTRSTGQATICLRPPGVIDETKSALIRQARESTPESEWSPFWEYGAFIDVGDLAGAVTAALIIGGLTGHHRLLVNADDISSASDDGPTLADRLLPGVPFRRSARFDRDPFAALIDASTAHRVLDWTPRHRWRSGTTA